MRNERIFEKCSVLVAQHVMTEPYFNFWKEMKDRNEASSLIDVPPYNLRTNFSSTTGGKKVLGYFGVIQEQAKRWYFDRTELSYYVPNALRADCLVAYGPGPLLKNVPTAGPIPSERLLTRNLHGGPSELTVQLRVLTPDIQPRAVAELTRYLLRKAGPFRFICSR